MYRFSRPVKGGEELSPNFLPSNLSALEGKIYFWKKKKGTLGGTGPFLGDQRRKKKSNQKTLDYFADKKPFRWKGPKGKQETK